MQIIREESSYICLHTPRVLLRKKQSVARILRGKVERTQNHQWPQASRTRRTLVVKRRDTRSDSASSLREDLCI